MLFYVAVMGWSLYINHIINLKNQKIIMYDDEEYVVIDNKKP